MFHVEGDVDQVTDLARVPAAEEGSDEALDDNKGETPQIEIEVVVLDGHQMLSHGVFRAGNCEIP